MKGDLPTRPLTYTLLEQAYLSCVSGTEKPPVVLYQGQVWTLRADGGYDSRPITDEDCRE